MTLARGLAFAIVAAMVALFMWGRLRYDVVAILAQGGRFGGWTLHMKDGKPRYTYNYLGLQRMTVAGTETLPPGNANIRFEFAYDGNGAGKEGTEKLSVNGRQVATGSKVTIEVK